MNDPAPPRGLAQDPAHDRRQRRLLVFLALLFFAPLGVAFYMYYGHLSWRPVGSVNHGNLVNPPIPLPPVSLQLVAADASAAAQTRPTFLQGKWTLLYYGPGDCAARCRSHLYDTRQVRIALDRDMDRVQRIFVADGACCDTNFLHEQHPDLTVVRATAAAAPLLALLPTFDGVAPATAARVYLIDPLGNLMMSYADDAQAKGMLQDLKRLLRLSSVG